jgi:hypothetical protein
LLVLAMSVDPEVGRDGLPASVTEALEHEPHEAPAVAPTVHARAQHVPRLSSPPRMGAPAGAEPSPAEPRLFGAVGAVAGIMPKITGAAELGGRIPLRRGWSISLSVLGLVPQLVALPPSPYLLDDGIQLAAGQVNAALCRPLFGDRLELALCGGLAAGLRWVSARALGIQQNPAHPFYGPALSIESTLRAAPAWYVQGGITAQAGLGRERFTYLDHSQNQHVWYDPPLLSGRFSLGVGAFL